MNFPDKEFICKGEVAKKWEEGGQKYAELTIWAENDAGQKTTPGTAIVVFN